MQIKSACLEDIPGVLVLLQANHISNLSELEKKNGFVTTNMTDQQFVMLIHPENIIKAMDPLQHNGSMA